MGLPTKKAAKSFSNEEGGEFEGDYGEEEGEGAEEDWKNISWEEMQKAQITRTQLEKWVYAPFFERVVKGSHYKYPNTHEVG